MATNVELINIKCPTCNYKGAFSTNRPVNLNISAKDGHQISYNKDSNLWQIQNCPKPQATQKAPETTQATLAETSDSSALGRWWTNTDKFCTDGNDDGKLGIGEVAEFAFKGLFKGIRDILRNPVTSLLTTGILGGLTLLTGGAALPYILGAGIALGGIQTVIGLGKTYANWGNGKDKNTQAAIENMTSGMVTMALGIFGLKSFNVAKAGPTIAPSGTGTPSGSTAERVLNGIGDFTQNTKTKITDTIAAIKASSWKNSFAISNIKTTPITNQSAVAGILSLGDLGSKPGQLIYN